MNRQDRMIEELYTNYPDLQGIALEAAYDLLCKSCFAGNKILICGNGGSAADAEHMVGELMKGFLLKRELSQAQQEAFLPYGERGREIAKALQNGISAVSLNSQTSLLTAVGNDNGFGMTYAQQVHVYGKEGDILIAMSTTGNSANVVNAALTAKVHQMAVVGITGMQGGDLETFCDVCLQLPAKETYRIQEYTLPLYHTLCAMLERDLFAGHTL